MLPTGLPHCHHSEQDNSRFLRARFLPTAANLMGNSGFPLSFSLFLSLYLSHSLSFISFAFRSKPILYLSTDTGRLGHFKLANAFHAVPSATAAASALLALQSKQERLLIKDKFVKEHNEVRTQLDWLPQQRMVQCCKLCTGSAASRPDESTEILWRCLFASSRPHTG